MFIFNLKYFIAALALFMTEVLIALFVNDQIIRPYIGDLLVVILLYCVIKSFLDWPALHTAWSVLIFSYLIETLQYFNFVAHLGLSHSKSANIILGNSFAWLDILAYTLGIVIVLWAERLNLISHTHRKDEKSSLFI